MFQLVYKGKGKMPGYGKDCVPKVGVACSAPPTQLNQAAALGSWTLGVRGWALGLCLARLQAHTQHAVL